MELASRGHIPGMCETDAHPGIFTFTLDRHVDKLIGIRIQIGIGLQRCRACIMPLGIGIYFIPDNIIVDIAPSVAAVELFRDTAEQGLVFFPGSLGADIPRIIVCRSFPAGCRMNQLCLARLPGKQKLC